MTHTGCRFDYATEATEDGHYGDTTYMDYQKAIDKVFHGRLLDKLRAYTMNDTRVRWVKSCLPERHQYVQINERKSDRALVSSGISQGSVLGLVPFAIYIYNFQEHGSVQMFPLHR